MNNIQVTTKRFSCLLYLIGSLAFVFICAYFSLTDSLEQSTNWSSFRLIVYKAALFVAIPFFGLCSILYFKRLIVPPVLLIVDEQGITDNSSALPFGFIPWEDVADIVLNDFFNQTYISVIVKDQDRYLSKMNWMQRLASKANLKMGFPLVNITLNNGSDKPGEIYELIIELYGHYLQS